MSVCVCKRERKVCVCVCVCVFVFVFFFSQKFEKSYLRKKIAEKKEIEILLFRFPTLSNSVMEEMYSQHTECVTDLDSQPEMIIFELILTTFEARMIF